MTTAAYGAWDLAPKKFEIDVVAQHGHLWIEVKDSESLGVGSTRFLGSQGHVSGKTVLALDMVDGLAVWPCLEPSAVPAGIQQQAMLRVRAAHLQHNMRRWTPIAVLFHFPSGVGE